MTNREIFRKNFAELLRVSKVKQADVARYAEVSYKTVSAWVCGRGYPRAEQMEKICQFFGIKQSALTESKDSIPEDRLLLVFRSLSPEGQRKMLERAEEMKLLYPKRREPNEETAE